MKKSRFTEAQMVTILREADRRPVPEVAKQHGVSAQTIYSNRPSSAGSASTAAGCYGSPGSRAGLTIIGKDSEGREGKHA